MKRRYRLLIFVLFLGMVFTGDSLRGQETSPLGFRTLFPRVGAEVGLEFVSQNGTYSVGCGQFDEGSKANINLAGAYDFPLGPQFRIEGLLGYRQRNVSGSNTEVEASVIRTDNGFGEADVNYEHVGDARFGYLFFQPSLKMYPTSFLYVGGGAGGNILISSRFQYTRNILTRAVTVDNRVVEVFFPAEDSSDPYSRVFPGEDVESASSFVLDALLYVGMELNLSRDIIVGPRFTYNIPLIEAATDPSLKLNSLMVTVGLRYNLR